MGIVANIKQYRAVHHISQEYMADKLAMCQPNYSRIERSEAACANWLPRIANALDTTPEMLQNYHFAPNAEETLEAADWVKAALAEKDELLQEQEAKIRFQDRYITYIHAVWEKYGILLKKPADDLPTLETTE